jgi:hypothetical protein
VREEACGAGARWRSAQEIAPRLSSLSCAPGTGRVATAGAAWLQGTGSWRSSPNPNSHQATLTPLDGRASSSVPRMHYSVACVSAAVRCALLMPSMHRFWATRAARCGFEQDREGAAELGDHHSQVDALLLLHLGGGLTLTLSIGVSPP